MQFDNNKNKPIMKKKISTSLTLLFAALFFSTSAFAANTVTLHNNSNFDVAVDGRYYSANNTHQLSNLTVGNHLVAVYRVESSGIFGSKNRTLISSRQFNIGSNNNGAVVINVNQNGNVSINQNARATQNGNRKNKVFDNDNDDDDYDDDHNGTQCSKHKNQKGKGHYKHGNNRGQSKGATVFNNGNSNNQGNGKIRKATKRDDD